MRGFSAWIALGLLASVPTVALADVISDEEAQCRSKKEGDACEIGSEKGTCTKSTCGRNDYSEGVPPKMKQVECMICEVGKAPEPAAAEEPAAKDETKGAANEDAAKAESKDDGPTAKKPKSSGCSIGGGSPALGLMLLGFAVARRRGR